MFLPEDLHNRSPGFGALVVWEETPFPLPVGGPIDGLSELTRQHCVVITPGHGIGLLLAAEGGPALLGSPFHIGVTHQARVPAPLPEVHLPGDPCLDLLAPADAQRLSENKVGKDEGSLKVLTP